MKLRSTIALLLLLAIAQDRGQSCSICDPNFQQRPTLRQSARLAKFVVIGTLRNPRLDGDKGATDFHIEEVVQNDAALGKQKMLTIPAYVPTNAKDPSRFLLFGDFLNGKLDIVSSRQVKTNAIAKYLAESLKIDDRERTQVLLFCFKHLDDVDPDVATDAFHEFAKATDTEVAEIGKRVSAAKVRALLKDPKTPGDRLGMYAYLLGACGTKEDAAILIEMIRANTAADSRGNPSLSGMLGGLIELQPEKGWALLKQLLQDEKQPFANKLAAMGTLRFCHACKPKQSDSAILDCLAAIVENGDMADMAVEDLRRWQWWGLTKLVLSQYGKPSHAAPLVRQAIVRYAMVCPNAEAVAFVKQIRQADPKMVARVEESLEFEKPLPAKKNP